MSGLLEPTQHIDVHSCHEYISDRCITSMWCDACCDVIPDAMPGAMPGEVCLHIVLAGRLELHEKNLVAQVTLTTSLCQLTVVRDF